MVRTTMSVMFLAGFLSLSLPDQIQAFRCGSGLVVEGDSMGKVQVECGAPTYKEKVGTKTDVNALSDRKGNKRNARSHAKDGKVERWTYNCGEHDFIYVLTFEGGVLIKEETQGYGKGRSDCTGRK